MTASPAEPILHIVARSAWAAAGDLYRDPSLDTEGFIHCSTPAQVLMPADALFAGRQDLILLVIDPGLIDSPVVFEDCYESGIEFPHVYGPIPSAAVVDTVDFPPGPDGTFELPEALAKFT